MKKAKPKSHSAPKNVEQNFPPQKAAIRSDAFARALQDAKSYANDPEHLRKLFEEAAKKAASIPREPFKANWPYLQAMLRLIRAYYRGEYHSVSEDPFLWIIAALSYLVDPFDLIPDEVPFLGFVDDASVVEFAVTRTRRTLDDFMLWETSSRPRG
jgi:uncharacterized membrane protein YkvA (DUF1232 family)